MVAVEVGSVQSFEGGWKIQKQTSTRFGGVLAKKRVGHAEDNRLDEWGDSLTKSSYRRYCKQVSSVEIFGHSSLQLPWSWGTLTVMPSRTGDHFGPGNSV